MINLFSKIHDLQCVSHKYHRIKNNKSMSLLLVGHSSSFSINAVDYTYLVGGFSPSEKYESQWEGLSHILWKIKKCSKQPTSYGLHYACFLRVHSLQNRICLSNLSQPRFLLSCMASKHVQNTSRKMKTCNQYGSTNQSLLNSIYF